MEENKAWILLIVISLVTIFLRIIPFIIFKDENKTPKIINKLSSMLPYSIMGMLVIYCIKDLSFDSIDSFLPEILGVLVVALLYIWKKNTLISIIIGTIFYMVLVQFVF